MTHLLCSDQIWTCFTHRCDRSIQTPGFANVRIQRHAALLRYRIAMMAYDEDDGQEEDHEGTDEKIEGGESVMTVAG